MEPDTHTARYANTRRSCAWHVTHEQHAVFTVFSFRMLALVSVSLCNLNNQNRHKHGVAMHVYDMFTTLIISSKLKYKFFKKQVSKTRIFSVLESRLTGFKLKEEK